MSALQPGNRVTIAHPYPHNAEFAGLTGTVGYDDQLELGPGRHYVHLDDGEQEVFAEPELTLTAADKTAAEYAGRILDRLSR